MALDSNAQKSVAAQKASEYAFDLVGLGQNSVDQLIKVEQFPRPGSKSEASSYDVLPGGQVATAILAGQRLGLRSRYIGAVGDDPLGSRACEVLRQDGVALEIKVVQGALTKCATILVDSEGERTIIESFDAQTVVLADDLSRDWIVSARVLHLDITDIPTAIQAAKWARAAQTFISLGIDRVLPDTDQLLPLVDLLVASENLPRELGASSDVDSELDVLRTYCHGIVCVTRGEHGSVAFDGEQIYRAPAFEIEAVDTTGCGDVFRGALIYGLLQQWKLDYALRFASAAAALQAGTLGAQAGVPMLRQVNAFLDSDPQIRNNE